MTDAYNHRVEAAALAIAGRRGHGRLNKEHPLWEYYIQDAKDALAAAAQAETPDFNRQMDEIMCWVRSLPDERTWLPIETAPKDGTYVLTFTPSRVPQQCVLRWVPSATREQSKWQEGDGRWYVFGPTLWQPLPEPPSP